MFHHHAYCFVYAGITCTDICIALTPFRIILQVTYYLFSFPQLDMGEVSPTTTDLIDFFKDANDDGLNITWAHAVNSKTQLEEALKGKVMPNLILQLL